MFRLNLAAPRTTAGTALHRRQAPFGAPFVHAPAKFRELGASFRVRAIESFLAALISLGVGHVAASTAASAAIGGWILAALRAALLHAIDHFIEPLPLLVGRQLEKLVHPLLGHLLPLVAPVLRSAARWASVKPSMRWR